MRVLHINGVIHQGSTGAIVDSINQCLDKHGEQHYTTYGIGNNVSDGYKFCYRYEQAIYRRCSMITGLRYGFAPFSTARLIKMIKQYSPDIVHIHSINGNCVNIYQLLYYLKHENIVTVVTNHAEFFYTGNCTYTYGCKKYISGCKNCKNLKWASDGALIPRTEDSWHKMKEAFSDFENLTIVSVSDYTKKRSEKSPILAGYRHHTILNGIDIKVFTPTFSINIREKYHLSANKIGVFVTSGFSADKYHIKGGYWAMKLAEQYSKEEFQLLVVGSEGGGIRNDNVVFAGKIEDTVLLSNIYSQADITLAFSKAESFGLTCAESLCCGTPFVGFLCGGTESIALKEFSRFVDYGNIDSMMNSIDELLNGCHFDRKEIAEQAKNKYSNEIMAENYHSLYKDIQKLK